MKQIVLITTASLWFVATVYGSNFLLFPGMATSHCLEMMSIGQEMIKRGHNVTLFAMLFDPKPCLTRFELSDFKDRFRLIVPQLDPKIQQRHDTIMDEAEQTFYEGHVLWFLLKHLPDFLNNLCGAQFYDKQAVKQLEDSHFDLVLVEGLPFTSCLFCMPVHLGVPSVAVSSFVDPQDSRMPLQSNVFPNLLLHFSNDMTFMQRMGNTLMWFGNPILRYFMLPAIDMSQYSDRLKGVDIRNMAKDAILYLENSDYVVDYPKAIFPNFVQVGGLTASPPRQLTGEIKHLVENSKPGVILVSFGSVLKQIPPEVIQKLKTALSQLGYGVLFKYNSEETYKNIKMLKWVPQNDILGHKKTKLFISHCGKNGFWEAVFNAVPIICVPVHAETPSTAVKVRKYQIGSSIDIFRDTVDDIVNIVNSVLEDDNILRNMKKVSQILRDRPETPSQRAVSAIEHVIKYGSSHLKPPEIEFISYIYGDVWLVIFTITALLLYIDILLVRKCCCKRSVNKQKTE